MTFDAGEGRAAKEAGMELAALAAKHRLQEARMVAVKLALAHPDRECHADAIGEYLKAHGKNPSLGPAAGSIFKTKDWEFTGRRVQSKRATNHAREIKVWRYTGPASPVSATFWDI